MVNEKDIFDIDTDISESPIFNGDDLGESKTLLERYEDRIKNKVKSPRKKVLSREEEEFLKRFKTEVAVSDTMHLKWIFQHITNFKKIYNIDDYFQELTNKEGYSNKVDVSEYSS